VGGGGVALLLLLLSFFFTYNIVTTIIITPSTSSPSASTEHTLHSKPRKLRFCIRYRFCKTCNRFLWVLAINVASVVVVAAFVFVVVVVVVVVTPTVVVERATLCATQYRARHNIARECKTELSTFLYFNTE
jgi:hypothetical protein